MTTGKRTQLLAHDLLRQAKACRHCGRFGLCRIAAGLFEILHGLVVTVHRSGHDVRIRVGHFLFGLAHTTDDGSDVSRAHHAVERGLFRIGSMRVLRQIAELARYTHFAGGGQHVAGDHAGERGLAGAVTSDQTDLVALGDVEIRGMQQRARADLNLKLLRFNCHASTPLHFRYCRSKLAVPHITACPSFHKAKRQSNIIPNACNHVNPTAWYAIANGIDCAEA